MSIDRVRQRMSDELQALEQRQRKRTLHLGNKIDFSSNDYLGLTKSTALRQEIINALQGGMPLGSGGSRLLGGNNIWHEEAEQVFASFKNVESALFFSSGYHANMAVLSAIPTRRDLIVYDSMVHASIKEGIRASLATKKSFEHNSIESLKNIFTSVSQFDQVFVVVESLYSMDGDEAPLKELALLSEQFGFLLIVDEAHATGLFGFHGRGLVDEAGISDSVFATIHPCGKALAASGAFVCGSSTLTSYLVNRARTMIFTTALPPIVSLTLRLVITVLQTQTELIDRVHKNGSYVRNRLTKNLNHWKISAGRSPIIPVIIGEDAIACEVADKLQAEGLDVRAIRPPTVAEGSSRFRITVNAMHTEKELNLLCDGLIRLERNYH